MKAIMYHYVRERDPSYPHFRYLDIKNFRKQLDYFSNNYGFVSKDEWMDYINGDLNEMSNKIILTFDDAMSCHYDYVFPELESRKLWGIFYVPSKPYISNKLLDVHKVHLLCGAYDGVDLLDCLLKLINENMMPDKKRKEFRNNTYLNQTNVDGVTEFKRILNYFIDYDFREDLINKVSKVFNHEYDSKFFYVSKDGLLEMYNAGNIIGSHTVNHPVMSKLSKEQQNVEINESFKFLESLGCNTIKTYCHPYGGFHSFNKDTIEILNKNNVNFSFNVESRDIIMSDIFQSNHHLPRYDCNEFQHGKIS